MLSILPLNQLVEYYWVDNFTLALQILCFFIFVQAAKFCIFIIFL